MKDGYTAKELGVKQQSERQKYNQREPSQKARKELRNIRHCQKFPRGP